jgi:hypothetical protein
MPAGVIRPLPCSDMQLPTRRLNTPFISSGCVGIACVSKGAPWLLSTMGQLVAQMEDGNLRAGGPRGPGDHQSIDFGSIDRHSIRFQGKICA